ncbi:MAG: SNF2-related protein [Silvanigrellaceae bacterium]
MAGLSFVDIVFPQFAGQHWQGGISLFRSGSVVNVSFYGELVSARVRAGIGENYDVRLKLHAQGKGVQWMECTCQANRRRGEKCQHLAALCLVLDQERAETLAKFGLSGHGSDKYLYKKESAFENILMGESADEQIAPAIQALKPGASGEASRGLGIILTEGKARVLSAQWSDEDCSLQLTLDYGPKKSLTYNLQIDDAVRVLTSTEISAQIPKKVLGIVNSSLSAVRVFDCRKFGPAGVQIFRTIVIKDSAGRARKTIELEGVDVRCLGRLGVFVPKSGLVLFKDEMTPAQVARWEEYPRIATLDNDTAALLLETNFDRLRETAEIKVATELAKVKVFSKFSIPELKLKSTMDGLFYVEPTILGIAAGRDKAEGSEQGVPTRGAELGIEAVATDGSMHSNILVSILKARAEGKKFISTKNGWLKLPEELDWLAGNVQADGRVKLTTLELIKFREQFAAESEIVGTGDVVARLRSGLLGMKDIELPSLGSTRLNLRPYQIDGFKWLWWLYSNGLGGLLADEMGLGKTHQTMALISAVANRESKKVSLVVCPTSVIDHWLDKMAQFVPGVRVVCYHGSERKQEAYKRPSQHTVLVTSYGILLRDFEFLMRCPIDLVILDEAHLVKNQSTRTYRAAVRLGSRMRLCLTGTPLENDLLELKNLFDYIAPNYLGSDSEFRKKYMSEKRTNPLADLELQRLIHPFKLRRNKREVLTDLPDKVEDIRHCNLNKRQVELYNEALALRGRELVEALECEQGPIPYVHIFSVISFLKQICNDPAMLDPRYEGVGSGKLALFDEILSEALASDQKVVVFSQYAKTINRLSDRLNQRGVNHVVLTGQSSNRGQLVRQFQEDPTVKVFLGSLLAGGTGIDLTAANVVIHFDRWWNAAKENQATDRIHRIGQQKNVQVYKLVTKGTLEERIDEIINRKKLIFERFVEEDSEMFKNLSREDLLKLLAPAKADDAVDGLDETETPNMDALVHDGVIESHQI